jgi:hypothetical protein
VRGEEVNSDDGRTAKPVLESHRTHEKEGRLRQEFLRTGLRGTYATAGNEMPVLRPCILSG